jgi:succinate dehydrogenase/fumarate reductase flavoprotein subunit
VTVELASHRADVVVVGAGAAGMYAAIEAHRAGADVVLVDKSLIGRGGATVMAQMTVAAAVGHAEPDSPELHYADTLASSRGLTDEPLAELLCAEGPRRILETRDMGVDWAADGDRLRQVVAPGHSRRRCCYVDVLATGQSVSRAMRIAIRRAGIRVATNVVVSDVVTGADGEARGVVGLDLAGGEPVVLWAPAVVLACGGLTELYARNSASANMTGDAYGLALAAGADLVDMEMVQFFPIANLAPRAIGLDPIMWDPFRYKLGGRLLNGAREEFVHRYGDTADEGTYRATRDIVSFAILKEVEAGRGSPAGGAYLDFTDIPFEQIHAAFPPVVDKLAAQGIDLTKQAVEVAPMAHYTIGGVRVGPDMATSVPGLYAAGEAVGGAHGANRLSGNAITEAFVFGAVAGVEAARHATATGAAADDVATRTATDRAAAITALRGRPGEGGANLPTLRRRLKQLMWDDVGPFRTAEGLDRAGAGLGALAEEVAAAPVGPARKHNMEWAERLEMELMVRVADAVRLAATAREESRGAHQREDHPDPDDEAGTRNGVLRAVGGALEHRWEPVRAAPARPAAVASAGGA